MTAGVVGTGSGRMTGKPEVIGSSVSQYGKTPM